MGGHELGRQNPEGPDDGPGLWPLSQHSPRSRHQGVVAGTHLLHPEVGSGLQKGHAESHRGAEPGRW